MAKFSRKTIIGALDTFERMGHSEISRFVRAINTCTSSGRFRYEKFERAYPTLHRGLKRDGFTVEDGHLRRALPVALNLPQADDEVHTLLDGYGLATAQGHLDQAIEAHTRGHWAAAFQPYRLREIPADSGWHS